MFNLFNKTNSNRERMINILRKVPIQTVPIGWHLSAKIAVGGLTEIGFSRETDYLLVVSSSGRSVINCCNGEKIARDYAEDGDWYNPQNLLCVGIGPIKDEVVAISGICGGGLPTGNHYGETLELASPEWPMVELFFCPPGKSVLIERCQDGCIRLVSEYVLCAGFSWSGKFIVSATSSDITIWQRAVA